MKLAAWGFALSLIVIGMSGCSNEKQKSAGSFETVSETRDVSGFNQLFFNGNGNLIISQGDTESVSIEGDKEVVEQITTFVVENALRIDYKRGKKGDLINTREPVTINVKVKEIQEIRLTGSGTISTTDPLETYQLKVSLSGTGKGTIGVVGHKLVTILSGSSNFVVKGVVENQDIWISGSGIYQARELKSQVANINISGSGEVFINAEDILDVRLSGSGSVHYRGEPRIRQSISGAGSVLKSEG